MSDTRAIADATDPELSASLTREEDDELRRLNYMAEIGVLSAEKLARMKELSQRDRRQSVRPPREFEPAPPRAPRTGRS